MTRETRASSLVMLLALTGLVAGCGDAKARTADQSTQRTQSQMTYHPATVEAAFRRHGLALRRGQYFRLNSVPHVDLLAYSVPMHVTRSGTVRGGLYFQLFVFSSLSAAKRGLSPGYVAELRGAREPWQRLSNVVLVAASPVILANHNHAIWRRAVATLKSLAR